MRREMGRQLTVPSLRTATAAALATGLYLLVLLAHGALPGMVGDPSMAYLVEGSMTCLRRIGFEAISGLCPTLGEPFGYPFLTAGPLIYLGALLMYVPGMGSAGAYTVALMLLLALALFAGYLLLCRLGAGAFVALGTSFAYLMTPTVIGMRSFLGTSAGFVLLPLYLLADLMAISAVEKRTTRTAALTLVAYTAVKTAAAFMDGYSFVASSLISALVWLEWCIRSHSASRTRRLAGAGLLVAAHSVAALLYALYAPGGSAGAQRIEVFRSMGLDLATLVLPSGHIWPAATFGYYAPLRHLWGDGSNAAYNYVGFLCVGLAATCVILRRRDGRLMALAAAGFLALVLSLGPALKVNVAREPERGIPSFESYLMPEGLAPELPWAGLYTTVPGVSTMRATYRWFGVTRLVLVILAGLAVGSVSRAGGRRRVLALCLAGAAMVELSPNVPRLTNDHLAGRKAIEVVTREVGNDLRESTSPGERAFFLNYDGLNNDWMSNYLVPMAGLRSYNAGGDKNAALASKRWPDEVKTLAQVDPGPQDVLSSFEAGHTDVVIAPFFHLRNSSYRWPPSDEEQAEARRAFRDILDDPRLQVDRYRWLAVIRPANPDPVR